MINFLSYFLKILQIEVVDNFSSPESVWVDFLGFFFKSYSVLLLSKRTDFGLPKLNLFAREQSVSDFCSHVNLLFHCQTWSNKHKLIHCNVHDTCFFIVLWLKFVGTARSSWDFESEFFAIVEWCYEIENVWMKIRGPCPSPDWAIFLLWRNLFYGIRKAGFATHQVISSPSAPAVILRENSIMGIWTI